MNGAVPGLPVHSMKQYLLISEGDIVQVEPGLTPIGMRFTTGEKLRVRISGVDRTVLPPVDQATLEVEEAEDINQAVTVTIHGGLANMAGSFLVLPVLS